MTQETQILFAILLYVAFFAWIGWRRGARAEATVFLVALITWVLLQERGNIFVRITNLGIKFLGLLGASVVSGEVNESQISSSPDFVASGAEQTFLFILWILILFATYLFTSRPSFSKGSKKSAWAAIFGALNGLLYLAVMLPRFNQLYVATGGQFSEAPLRTFVSLLTQFVQYLVQGLRSLWLWLQPISPLTLLIVVTVLLALIALTLRRGVKAKTPSS
jgi:hypothetical protein